MRRYSCGGARCGPADEDRDRAEPRNPAGKKPSEPRLREQLPRGKQRNRLEVPKKYVVFRPSSGNAAREAEGGERARDEVPWTWPRGQDAGRGSSGEGMGLRAGGGPGHPASAVLTAADTHVRSIY